jgi:hypothetical protein
MGARQSGPHDIAIAAASPGLETGGAVSVAIHANDCIKNVQDSVSEPSAQATTPLAEGDTVAVG